MCILECKRNDNDKNCMERNSIQMTVLHVGTEFLLELDIVLLRGRTLWKHYVNFVLHASKPYHDRARGCI